MTDQQIALFDSQRSEEWGTPQAVFDELDREFHFDLDPCATDANHKCDRYYTKADDGLSRNWGGCRVFCNPPYGKAIKGWVRKCHEEGCKPGTLVVLLTFANTDTAWFHDFIYHRAEIRFIRGRLKFNDGERPAMRPSMISIFRGPGVK